MKCTSQAFLLVTFLPHYCLFSVESFKERQVQEREQRNVVSSDNVSLSFDAIFLFSSTGMSWDFFVPVCVGDLVKTGGVNQYVVQDVLSPKQLPSHLHSEWLSS